MTQRLELFGEPGTGKTSLLRSATASTAGLMAPDQALLHYYFQHRNKGILAALYRLGIPIDWFRSKRHFRKSVAHRARRSLMVDSPRAYVDCAKVFYRALATIQARDHELVHIAHSFERSMAVALVAEALNSSAFVLQDEGFLQRGLSLLVRNAAEEPVQQYFATIPAPGAIIRVSVEREERLRRLHGRGAASGREQLAEALQLTDWQSAQAVEHGVAAMRARDIPVFEVDGSKPPDEQIRLLRTQVEQVPDA